MSDLVKFAVEHGDGSFAYRPSVVGSHVRVLSAATAANHDIPTDVNSEYAKLVLFSADCDFWVTPITEAEETIVTNGTFASDTSWTKGTGWTIGSGVASSDASQTGDSDLEQTSAVTLIEGRSYTVSFTVTSYTAGNVTPVIGGTEGTDRGSAATFTETIIAGSSQTIALRADSDFQGSVDNFTVTPIAVSPATNSTGGSSMLNPLTWNIGGKYSRFSLYSTDGGNVNMQFFA